LHIENSTTLEFIKPMMKFKGSNLDEQKKKKCVTVLKFNFPQLFMHSPFVCR
jgi:hypothetical protein